MCFGLLSLLISLGHAVLLPQMWLWVGGDTGAGDTSQGGGNLLHSSEAFRCLIWYLDALIALMQEALKCPGDMGLRCSRPRVGDDRSRRNAERTYCRSFISTGV